MVEMEIQCEGPGDSLTETLGITLGADPDPDPASDGIAIDKIGVNQGVSVILSEGGRFSLRTSATRPLSTAGLASCGHLGPGTGG